MTHIINNNAIILFVSGKTIRIEKTDRRYPQILEVFALPKDEQEAAVELLMAPVEVKLQQVHGKNKFEVVEGSVLYAGEKLPPAFEDKILSILRDGLPVEHFEKFWENLQSNPSSQSVSELIEFLSYKELPITDDGFFLAYKGVNTNYYSVHGNTETKVLQGTVDASGRILNSIGEVVEVRRRDVDDDRRVHCSHGLHVGSVDYATGFGTTTVVVKVNPADVVSVPSDYNCQKCRVAKYEVVADFVQEITASVTDGKGADTLVPDKVGKRNEFINRVDSYLSRKITDGYEEVTVRQIQNSFSPQYPSKQAILDALQELDVTWTVEDGSVIVHL